MDKHMKDPEWNEDGPKVGDYLPETDPTNIAPRPEEEIEKHFRIATSKYNPFAVGNTEEKIDKE